MIYSTGIEVEGKRVWAYIPKKDGSLEFRQGFIEKFIRVGAGPDIDGDPMYLVKYDDIEIAKVAQPEWLISPAK